MSRLNLLSFQILCVALATVTPVSGRDSPPPDPAELLGAWVGFEKDVMYFCRLDLTRDGRGYCSFTYFDDPPKLYEVKAWSLDGFVLDITLSPVDKGAEPIHIRGQANHRMMLLEFGGVEKLSWKRQMTLVKDTDLAEKNKQAKERIEKQKSSTK